MADSTRHLTLSEVLDRIHARTIPEPNTGCYLWEGHPRLGLGNGKMYGLIRYNGPMQMVHRVVWEAAHGPLQPGQQVLHSCDQPACNNLDHLFVGTNDDNHADKARKDRGKKRLTHAKALEIHRLAREGMKVGQIADKYDLHNGYVSNLLSGKRRPYAYQVSNQ